MDRRRRWRRIGRSHGSFSFFLPSSSSSSSSSSSFFLLLLLLLLPGILSSESSLQVSLIYICGSRTLYTRILGFFLFRVWWLSNFKCLKSRKREGVFFFFRVWWLQMLAFSPTNRSRRSAWQLAPRSLV
jgi:hypothetical protein